MMKQNDQRRLRRVLIGTVGGQGGGVLSAWLVRGLINHGWDAISIGLLGISQRAGTVTYYVEAAPAAPQRRVNSVFATAGDVDLLIGQELLEVGRLLQGGYAAPHCVLIGNTYRYLTTLEKMPSEDGIFDSARILDAVQRMAPNGAYLVHAQEVVASNGLSAMTSNAFLLGAAVGSPVFDLPAQPFLDAIRADQVAVEANTSAFLLGYDMVRDGRLASLAQAERMRLAGGPAHVATPDLDFRPGARFSALFHRTAEGSAARRVVAASGNLLASYQDAAYADEFADKLAQVEASAARDLVTDPLWEPLCLNLANWMAYEDPMRVAQLKTAPERFATLAHEFRQGRGLVTVRDYMVPDAEQLLDALPPSIERLFRREGEEKAPQYAAKFPLRLRSNGVLGFWTLRLLASLRGTRRASARHQRELHAIGQWLDAVAAAARRDQHAGLVVAEAGRVVKGYGWTRKKALADIGAFATEGARQLEELATNGRDVLKEGRAAVALMAKQAGNWDQCRAHLERAAG